MKDRMWILTGLLLVVLVVTLGSPVSSQPAQAQEMLSRVRMFHAVPGAPSVDVYANGTRIAAGLAYGEVTPHVTVPSGEYQVALRQSGTGADAPALIEATVSLTPNSAFTVVAQGAPGAIETMVYEDILFEIELGKARLKAISAVADAPALDIVNKTSGGPLMQGISYNQDYGTIDPPAGVQDLVIVPAGGAVESALAEIGPLSLDSGTLYTIVAIGTLEDGVMTKVLATPVNAGADSVRVRIAHGSPDAPAVDVYADDILIAAALELGDMTGHIAIPVGTYTLAVRAAGADPADDPLLNTEITLAADSPPQTVVMLGQMADDSLAIQEFDDPAEAPEDMAVLNVVNAVSGATASVTLNDPAATVLASDLAASTQSDSAQVTPGDYMLNVSIDTGNNPITMVIPAGTYYGGMVYTALVYGSETSPYNATVDGTALNVGLLSMPEPAQPAAVAAQPTQESVEVQPEATEALPLATEAPVDTTGADLPLATQAPAVVVPPTQAPAQPIATEAPQTDSELVVQPTQAQSELVVQPTQAATQPPQPVAPQTSPQPIAYVELDPGANLHCRELPGSDKKSLALIPSGTTLTVIGRTGTPLVPETGNATPEPTPEVESIEELWLAVRWEPQGGGYVTCWVSAQFLRVEFRGRLLDELEELWELPEEPFNRPGEVVGADVSPPTPIFDAVIATVELEPGVSLQLRRNPETMAESLELVPAQAQLEVLGYAEAPSEGLVGQPTDPNWLYVRYRTENGGATIGWVSLQYVSLSRLGHPVEIADLPVVDVGEPGYYELPGQAPPIPLEQQDVVGVVNLNPGANLNLRDRPSADGRVVVGIPSGDVMVINGRNGDGTWVQVTYESAAGDLEGWVAAQYLQITRGGQPYDVRDLPILTTEEDTMEG